MLFVMVLFFFWPFNLETDPPGRVCLTCSEPPQCLTITVTTPSSRKAWTLRFRFGDRGYATGASVPNPISLGEGTSREIARDLTSPLAAFLIAPQRNAFHCARKLSLLP